jgi:hypothetical protein
VSALVTAEQVISAAPPGSTVTIQLDAEGRLVAWYVRQPDASKRRLFK